MPPTTVHSLPRRLAPLGFALLLGSACDRVADGGTTPTPGAAKKADAVAKADTPSPKADAKADTPSPKADAKADTPSPKADAPTKAGEPTTPDSTTPEATAKTDDPTTPAVADTGAAANTDEPTKADESAAPPTPSAAASIPLLPDNGGSFASDDSLLSEKIGRRLRSTLRKDHDAVTQLAATIVLPESDGGATVVALYEYSLFEVCVAKGGKTKEARRKCVDEATDANGEPMAALRKCTGRGLVRARFGPPPASNPAYGGALTVVGTRDLTGGCTIDTVHAFRLHDVDNDGRPELEVDLVTNTPDMTFREPVRYDVKHRQIGWYREDLTPQFEQALGTWGQEDVAGDPTEGSVFEFIDVGGDGTVDLTVKTWEIDGMDCALNLDAWIASVHGCALEESEFTTATWLYDRAKDTWTPKP